MPKDPENDDEAEDVSPTPPDKTPPRAHEIANRDYIRRLKKTETDNDNLRVALDGLAGKFDEQNAVIGRLDETKIKANEAANPPKTGFLAELGREISNFFKKP